MEWKVNYAIEVESLLIIYELIPIKITAVDSSA